MYAQDILVKYNNPNQSPQTQIIPPPSSLMETNTP